MVTSTAVEAPRSSDCLQTPVHGQPALLILTRTISRHTGIRRWLVSLDSEVVGAINEQPHGWWGVEPSGINGCTDRYRTWQQAAKAAAELTLGARRASEAAAKKALPVPAACHSRRPGLRLVWSAT